MFTSFMFPIQANISCSLILAEMLRWQTVVGILKTELSEFSWFSVSVF